MKNGSGSEAANEESGEDGVLRLGRRHWGGDDAREWGRYVGRGSGRYVGAGSGLTRCG